jgi:hypothetical protein
MPLLQVAGLIHHQHRVLVAQMLDDKAADVITYCIGIPFGPRQQVLQSVGGRIPGMLSERPAVLARQLRQQPQHECPRPAPWFHPHEPPRDTAHQDLERLMPAAGIYAVTCGHRLIFCLHRPMITGAAAASGHRSTGTITA